MSLIEKALGKAKVTPVAGAGDAAVVSGPGRLESAQPALRHASDPHVRMTEAMLDTLGLRAPKEQERQRASEYRHIKRQVVSELREHESRRVIVVASALAGEGKSFTSANLARSLALEPEHTVLLIDADVIKPFISQSLGIADRKGFMDALVDPVRNPEDLVLKTDIEGLSVMPAGSVSNHATEYFASARTREVLEQLLAVPNRIIVVDTLPLLQTTEARALAPFAGQVLLVVRAESTPQSAVQEALSVLGKGRNVKLVLNATVRTRITRYLGHGYGYGYDYNYSSSRGEGPRT
jgi:receptor protein-tyrosine kinase